jgi:hypothetical protein
VHKRQHTFEVAVLYFWHWFANSRDTSVAVRTRLHTFTMAICALTKNVPAPLEPDPPEHRVNRWTQCESECADGRCAKAPRVTAGPAVGCVWGVCQSRRLLLTD